METLLPKCLLAARDGIPLPPPVLPTGGVDTSQGETSTEPPEKNLKSDGYGPDLPPDEELRVDIAAYAVGCDFEKDLLYAHIELKSPGAYTPFVRFALARYQKNSAKYCALSSIVYVDYVQLTPNRIVSITRLSESPEAPRQITVSGPGKGDETLGHRTNILRIYRLTDRRVREQYPLEVKGEWTPTTESSVALFQWQFELTEISGVRYLIEEYEINQDGTERITFSEEVTLW